MAQWILVYTPQTTDIRTLAGSLAKVDVDETTLSSLDPIIDVWRAEEHVEVSQEEDPLSDSEPELLAKIQPTLPNPNLFRLSYYRDAALLEDIVCAISHTDRPILIDNDYGVVLDIDTVLAMGLVEFTRTRGGSFAKTGP